MEFDRGLSLCYLSPYPPEKEGVADYLEDLLAALTSVDGRTRATVICQQPGTDAAVNDKVHPLRIWRPNSLRSLLRIRRLVSSGNFDCVHLQFGPYGKYGGLAGEPLLAVFLLIRNRIPLVATIHSTWLADPLRERLRERHGIPGPLLRVVAVAFRWYMTLFLRQFESIILLSNEENPELTSKFSEEFRVVPTKLVQWTLPCVGDGPATRSEPLLPDGGPHTLRIVCPGFISRRKGLNTLIEAVGGLTDVPPFSLRIVGECLTEEDRAYLAELKRLADSSRGPARIEFLTDPTSPERLEREVASAQVVVLTHSYRTGPSALLCEFLHLGVPMVVASDPLFLPEPSSGPWVLVPPQDAKRLRNVLREILTDPNRRQSLSSAARSWAARHTYRMHAADHLEHYRTLMRRRGG